MASGSQNMTTYKAKQLVNTYGGQYIPVWVDNGILKPITGGTTGQFYRGDNTWSNTLTGNLTIGGNVYFTGLGEGLEFVSDNDYFGTNADARIIQMVDTNPGANTSSVDGGIIIRAVGRNGSTDTVRELLRIRGTNNDNNWHSGTFQWKGKDIVVETGTSSPTWSISIGGNAATATTASYLKTPNTAGFYTDQYGNFIHQRTTSGDKFNICKSDGSATVQIQLETGNITLKGTMFFHQNRYPVDLAGYPFYNNANSANTHIGCELYYDAGATNNYSNPRWYFRQYSYTVSSTTGLDYYESFRLPATAAGLASSTTYDILTTKNKVTNAQLQYSAITLGATSCSLGSTYDTITGPFNVLTSAAEAKAFSICRGSTGEATKIWVDDSYTHFYVENDETTANIEFRLHAADTESGGGANASTSYVYFLSQNNQSTIKADIFNNGYGSLYLNSKISTRPSGAAITQPGTDVNPVELVSFAKSGADFGIVHISNDGCYVCNSADMGWAFAVFDTDKTVDFSAAANASFYVKQNQEGAVFKGTVTATNFDGSADKVDDWHRDDIRKGCLSFTRNINSANPTNLNNLNDGMAYNYGSVGYWQHAPSSPTYGSCIALTSGGEVALGGQFYWDINHNSSSSTRSLWFRAANNLGWQDDWKQLVWNSGTWGISITGNATTATKATQDSSGNIITSYYVTLSTDQTITGTKTFQKRIIAYAYKQASNLPFITFDKPGSYATGIGPDGTNNRIKFGPCDLAGTAWTAQSSFNSNEWYFQGSITSTSTITTYISANRPAVQISPTTYANTGLYQGNGDGNGNGTANIVIRSWYGVGFMNGCTNAGTNGAITAGVDCRSGTMYAGTFRATSGHGYLQSSSGYFLAVQNDGNLVLYNANSTSRWSSGTASSYLTKTNIKTVNDDDIEKLTKLRVISFNYKPEMKMYYNDTRYGLIAEEVRPFYPNLVRIPDDYKSEEFDLNKGWEQPLITLDYEGFIPLLIRAYQLQCEEINELKKQIAILRKM